MDTAPCWPYVASTVGIGEFPSGSLGAIPSHEASIVWAMGVRGFESRLEQAVEGAFSRVFKSTVKPVEFGRKLEREMDNNRSVSVGGSTIVPNQFSFFLSPEDREQLEPISQTLTRELADAAREHARDEGYAFVGGVEVQLITDESLRKGVLRVEGMFHESDGASPPGSLRLSTGDRVPLGEYVVSVGRQSDCTIVLADPNVSRHHAEIRPTGTNFQVADLGSTNGTKVNGVKLNAAHILSDGDEIRFGNTAVTFEAS